MGLFKNIKEKLQGQERKKEESIQMQNQEEKDNEAIPVKSYIGKDGKFYLQLDYYSLDPEVRKQIYDTTRLIVDMNPESLQSANNVYNAKVSWYGMYDCEYIVDGKETGRKADMKSIRLRLDIQKFMNDRDYQNALVTQLLSRRRVTGYKEQELLENPEHQCGNYIGHIVMDKDGNYFKRVEETIGKEIYDLPEEVNIRQRYKEAQEVARQRRIAEKEEQIKKLQDEIKAERGGTER